VQPGDVVQISFAYRCGGSIPSLEASIRTELVGRVEEEAVREQVGAVVYA
jgi:hypothetical protein